MNWQEVEQHIIPVRVLFLIRDGAAASISDLHRELGVIEVPPTMRFRSEARVRHIVENLAEAGLVTMEGDKIAPTAMIGRIQRALNLSLRKLSEAREQEGSGEVFVNPAVIEDLRQASSQRFDLSKVARMCEELNRAYSSGSYLASALLLRALLNHVPPVFGHHAFKGVVSQAGKSVKALLEPLEENARKIADLHTHALIRHKECLPTRQQVEQFKAGLEVLLHEIIAKVKEPGRPPAEAGPGISPA